MMKANENKETGKPKDLLAEARERLAYCIEAEGGNRRSALEAIKFRNLEQWPDAIRRAREGDRDGARPCLTLDKTNQYINQVKNDQRQNRPAIKVRPVDDRADIRTAEIYQGLVRHIEDASNADVAYDTGFEAAVDGGFGYWRVVTEYCDESSFDQDIRIKRVRNRFSVFLDPDHQEPEGSDAKWGFISDTLGRDEYKSRWPGKSPVDFKDAAGDMGHWVEGKDKVRIAEYFRLEEREDRLLLLSNGTTVLESQLDPQALPLDEAGQPLKVVKERAVRIPKVRWYKIDGANVLEERDWPGRYIPIIEVVGNELDIEGKRLLSGLVRSGMDAQRMYNYSGSAFIEAVALAPRAPYIAAEGQLEGRENEWREANRRNIAVLQYKPVDNAGQPVPPPLRQPMPGIPAGWQQAMVNHEHDIQSALGMYNASLGAPSNEKSGRAILARQREGDVANFHYIDNHARSIRHTGRILIDLIPKIYDTKRIARILGEDGAADAVLLDPDQDEAVREIANLDGTIERTVYNLGVGKYDVTVSIGPAYTTKRQEAAEWMTQMVTAKPELMQVMGDIMFRNMDVPGADEIADRLKKVLPPELQDKDGEGNPNGEPNDKAMAMIQQLQAALVEAKQGLDAQKLDIDRYNAETNRIKALAEAQNKAMPETVQQIAQQLDALTTAVASNSHAIEAILRTPIPALPQ